MSDNNSRPRILVTGAAGKTGSAVVKQMLNQGFPLRALVRRKDERSAQGPGSPTETTTYRDCD